MEAFWVGSWNHIVFSAEELHAGEKCPVIRQLCFGPLETLEYGVSDGEFYFENEVLEGIGEGDRYFEIIETKRFLEVIENEIHLCEKYAPRLLKQVSEQLEEVCRRLKIRNI